MSWNIFKQISFINKIKKTIKQAKKTVDNNRGVAEDVKKKVGNVKMAIEDLLFSLPMLKPLYVDVVDIIKRLWK